MFTVVRIAIRIPRPVSGRLDPEVDVGSVSSPCVLLRHSALLGGTVHGALAIGNISQVRPLSDEHIGCMMFTMLA